MQYDRIVLNEPHASVEGLYDNSLSFWKIDEHFINDVVLKWTDWHTDFLFHGLCDHRVKTVRFPYSRFIVDAERLWDDPLEEYGQGIIYRHFDQHTRDIPLSAKPRLLNLWQWHQRRLINNLCPNALLLDCHSFPEDLSEVDICIGYNEDWSKPDLTTVEQAVNLFESCGYRVGLNEPYSNSITPASGFHYQSMMLEVNKRVYMKEGSLLLKSSYRHKKTIRELMAQLMSSLLTSNFEQR